ncbi:IS66 family transposase [Accumulibacter sp.]|uniref:IS66 family transposase n=1 Tax=Accumulibacter sp. TaxID=2053492 RepID=UPI00262DB576|nr:IS66 family transposase [Accumulibacter sp.]
MNSTTAARVLSLDEAAAYRPQQVVELSRELAAAKHQLDWFKRQVFGQKSERRIIDNASGQMSLGEAIDQDQVASPLPPVGRQVAAHTRRPTTRKPDIGDDSLPFFDASRVPVEVIELSVPEAEGLSPEQYEVIGHKNSYRLAQRPGSTVVLNYRRPVIKLKESQTIVCPAAPVGVIDGSRADVSFIAGMLIDKFAYHLPFYRQHQRLADGGITVSRPWLTQIGQQGIALLEPIYDAMLGSIRASRVKAMDETPIKAGRAGPGKLKAAYFWPVYGELDEVCFPFFESRRIEHVAQALGLSPVERGVLLTDGYTAYEHYTKKTGLTHAQCWAHTRRRLFEAKDVEPEAAARGLDFIGGLYAVEDRIREQKLSAAKKLDYRLLHAKPIVERFFAWVNQQFEAQGLLPSNPLTKALAYARERRFGLEVYLTDPDVPIDTNHLERALRAIPMGRKNWLFCWTELGAKHVGIMQSLIVTCRLHAIDPYDYLVDVLQRVGQLPASRVQELTPRLWKQLFAANPLRSPLHSLRP